MGHRVVSRQLGKVKSPTPPKDGGMGHRVVSRQSGKVKSPTPPKDGGMGHPKIPPFRKKRKDGSPEYHTLSNYSPSLSYLPVQAEFTKLV